MFCRRCNRDVPTYQDVIANQTVSRCAVCHKRLADGPQIPSAAKARLLSMDETTRRIDVSVDRYRTGTTLVEWMVVIAVALILSMVVLPTLRQATPTTNAAAR